MTDFFDYERKLAEYFNNLKTQILARPLNLGGVGSVDGGIGGPPGGFLGRLPQSRVTFDVTEDDTIYVSNSGVLPSGATLVTNLNNIRYRVRQLELASGTVAGGGHEIQDSGVGMTQRAALNFIGSTITVVDDAANDRTNVIIAIPSGAGLGDMLTSVYDTDSDGVVDVAESVAWAGVTDKPSTFAPEAHHTTHEAGGSDTIKLDDLTAPDDNTDLNVSTTRHGLIPKLSGSGSQYLNGLGQWTTISGASVATSGESFLSNKQTVTGSFTLVDDVVTVVNDSSHNAFPGSCVLADGTIMVVYRLATNHNTSKGLIYQRTSTDSGATWSAASLVYSDVIRDARDPSITRLKNGNLIVSCFIYNYSTPASLTNACRILISTDDGATWGTAIMIMDGYTSWSHCSSPVVEMPDGTLHLAIFGLDSGDTYQHCKLATSTDGGTTWSTSLLAESTSRHLQEPNLVLTEEGLLCLIRSDTPTSAAGHHYSCRSLDNGVTWDTPVDLWEGTGSPRVMAASNGALVIGYRKNSDDSYNVAYRYSFDGGYTWGAEQTIATTSTMAYCSFVEYEIGLIGFVYSVEETSANSTNGDIFWTTLLLTHEIGQLEVKAPIGVSPLIVTSTTLVTNLNADLLDGNHAAAFALAAHSTQHQLGGSDLIKLDDLGTPDDNTDLNATNTRHGLLPKLSNDVAQFLNGLGQWVTVSGTSSGSGTGHVIQDEGTPLTSRPNLNFVGAGVTVTDDSANNTTVVTVTVSGGASGGHTIQEEGTSLTARANLNFIGAGVTVADDSANDATTVTITSAAGSGTGASVDNKYVTIASGVDLTNEIVIPGLAGHPDRQAMIAGVTVITADEFDTTDTIYTAAPSAPNLVYNANTAALSHLYASANDNTERRLTKTWGQAGEFTAIAKLCCGGNTATTNFLGVSLYIGNSDDTVAIRATLAKPSSSAIWNFYCYTYASSTWTQRGTTIPLYRNDIYVKIVRDSSNTFGVYCSSNGITWHPTVLGQALTITVAKLGILLPATAATNEAAVDFIRANI